MFNLELVMRGLAVRIGTRGLAERIGTALCDGGVANTSCSGSCSEGRLCVRMGVVLALASRCIVLMYKVAICHSST